MVLLKLCLTVLIDCRYTRFKFQHGIIKTSSVKPFKPPYLIFKFQHGIIKTSALDYLATAIQEFKFQHGIIKTCRSVMQVGA